MSYIYTLIVLFAASGFRYILPSLRSRTSYLLWLAAYNLCYSTLLLFPGGSIVLILIRYETFSFHYKTT